MLCKARICFSQASVSTSFPRDSYIQTRSKCNSRILHIIELAKQEELHALQAGIRPSLREFEIKIHVNCPYKKMVGTEAPASVSTSCPWDYHIPHPSWGVKNHYIFIFTILHCHLYIKIHHYITSNVIIKSFTKLNKQSKNNCELCKARFLKIIRDKITLTYLHLHLYIISLDLHLYNYIFTFTSLFL